MVDKSKKSLKPIRLMVKRLWAHIDKKRRKQCLMLVLFMVLASFAEVISISSVVPFLAVIANPEAVFNNTILNKLFIFLGLNNSKELLLPITVFFSFTAVIAGLMRLSLVWFQTRLSYAIGADLSISIYQKTLYQPYSIHVGRNSSEIISGITNKANSLVTNCLYPMLNILSSSILLFIIMSALVYINPLMALASALAFSFAYLFIIRISKKHLEKNSETINVESTQVLKTLQEGLGGIRDVLLDGSQEVYAEKYKRSEIPLRRAIANVQTISSSPRFIVESLGMVLIAYLAYFIISNGIGVASSIALLGALILSAQRMLPLMQQIYASWAAIRGGQSSVKDALDLLGQPIYLEASRVRVTPVLFLNNIVLENINFRHSQGGPFILKKINLTIKKGSKVGFIGPTGGGKSTLLDILMGLLLPTEGRLLVDGREISKENSQGWQANIAHVPQNIFLADASIAENIAIGQKIKEIDYCYLQEAAIKAQISETINSMPDQYQTFVGERGIRLSGGQRQRIGIARALYKKSNVIILDEATNALDDLTESEVMHEIAKMSEEITVLIVAHRLSTLKNCDQVVELKEGRIRVIDSSQFAESGIF